MNCVIETVVCNSHDMSFFTPRKHFLSILSCHSPRVLRGEERGSNTIASQRQCCVIELGTLSLHLTLVYYPRNVGPSRSSDSKILLILG